MSEEDVRALLRAYEKSRSNFSQSSSDAISHVFSEDMIGSYLETAITRDMQPDRVLAAMFEACKDKKVITNILRIAVRQIMKGNFVSDDRLRAFSAELRKTIPKVAGLKTCLGIMIKVYAYGIREEYRERPIVAEELLALIPPIFEKIGKDESEISHNQETGKCCDFAQNWLNGALEPKEGIPNFVQPLLIDTLTELPLNEEQMQNFVESIIAHVNFENMPQIAEHLLPRLKNFPKLLTSALHDLIEAAMVIGKTENRSPANRRAECALIKTLCNVSSNSRAVYDAMVKVVTSPTELPTHFTPFMVSLCFNLSKLPNDKIRDLMQKLFIERLKDDATRVRSRFLSHIWAIEMDHIGLMDLERVMSLAVDMCKINLEGNVSRFVEFAFNMIDSAPTGNTFFKKEPLAVRESSSPFVPYYVRQINISVQILKDCIKSFRSTANEIFRKIVERVITNSPNSIYLIQCLDSPDHLLEVIDYIQYLELPVAEQLMRFAVPKIVGHDGLLSRAVIATRKAFFNRTDKAKLNGLAALFYLIQPRQEMTLTQYAGPADEFGSRESAAADEDLQQDIFNLMKRGFTQGDAIQADLYFFIPFLLQQNPEMAPIICDTFNEKLDQMTRETGFRLDVTPSVPHFLYCISRSLKILPDDVLDQPDWQELSNKMVDTCKNVSSVEFEYLMNGMEMFAHPDQRESVIAIISVLFNHIFIADKDIALDLFRLHDRIIHKKAEIDRLRKDSDLKSSLKFPCFMELSSLKRLFKYIAEEGGDYAGNHAIQLYALTNAKEMIHTLSELRLEERGERLKRVLTLGSVLLNAYTKVKWVDAPAGTRVNANLTEMVTTLFKQLFSFVFETYDSTNVEMFLQKSNLISPSQRISEAQVILLHNIKKNIREDSMACASNLCQISEQISMYSTFSEKFFKTVSKMMNQLINSNSPYAGKILHLAYYFAPKSELQWLMDVNKVVATKFTEEDAGGLSSALLELMNLINIYLSDVTWAIKTWLPQLYASKSERLGHMSETFCGYLHQIEQMCSSLLSINFKNFPPNYYESMVKLLCELYKTIQKILTMTLSMPSICCDALEELCREVTSSLDDDAIQFTIRNQIVDTKSHKPLTRQEKFDEKYAPQIPFLIDKVRAAIQKLSEKKVFESDDIVEGFCRLRGTDIRFTTNSKKKKQKVVEEEANMEEDGD